MQLSNAQLITSKTVARDFWHKEVFITHIYPGDDDVNSRPAHKKRIVFLINKTTFLLAS